ncbi:MAG: choice-of-anchor D domain-containing protein [Spirochaetales bacterium]|nr:choice-of-anchor D domain-containing protein [Spirochaetales bacterium]
MRKSLLFFIIMVMFFSCDKDLGKKTFESFDLLKVSKGNVHYNSPTNILPIILNCEDAETSSQQSFRLENLASQRLTVDSISLSYPDFSVKDEDGAELIFPVVLEKNSYLDLFVSYNPSLGGELIGSMKINFFRGIDLKTLYSSEVELKGVSGIVYGGLRNTGVELYGKNVSTYDFSTVLVGDEKTFPLVLSNVSKDSQVITIYQAVVGDSQFVVTGFDNYSELEYGKSFDLSVVFSPQQIGEVETSVTFYTSRGEFDFFLKGEGHLSSTSVFVLKHKEKKMNLDSEFYFLDQVVGSVGSSEIFSITNMGTKELVINEISTDLPLQISADDLPFTLSYGQTYMFDVRFAPSSKALFSGPLNINYDGNKFFSLTVKGEGLESGKAKLALFNLDGSLIDVDNEFFIPATQRNYISKRSVVFRNLGDSSLLIDAISFDYDVFSIEGISSFPFSIAANSFLELEFKFYPEYEGLYSGIVEIFSNSDGNGVVGIDLASSCVVENPILPPVFVSDRLFLDTRQPIWEWSTNFSSAGIGIYRYKLNDSNLEVGSVETSERSFSPDYLMEDGVYTLYIQEKDLWDNWSKVKSHSVTVAFNKPSAPLFIVENSEKSGNTYLVRQNDSKISWFTNSSEGKVYRYRISFDGGSSYVETSNSYIEIPSLPNGNYYVLIQAQDIYFRWGVAATFDLEINVE